jgi:hypothetical protein
LGRGAVPRATKILLLASSFANLPSLFGEGRP